MQSYSYNPTLLNIIIQIILPNIVVLFKTLEFYDKNIYNNTDTLQISYNFSYSFLYFHKLDKI